MLCAVGRAGYIFERSGNNVPDIASYFTYCDEFLSFGKMPQSALADAYFAPGLEIDLLDI